MKTKKLGKLKIGTIIEAKLNNADGVPIDKGIKAIVIGYSYPDGNIIILDENQINYRNVITWRACTESSSWEVLLNA